MTKIIYLCIILIVLLFFIKKKRGKEYFLNNDFKIVMFLTEGLNKEAENCIQTLKNLNLDTKLVVTALDDNAYNYISNLGVKTLIKNTNLQKEADFGTKDFYKIMYNKLEIIKKNLINYKKIILYSDTDIVFLKDISNDIDKFRKSKYDMMIQDDSPNFNNSDNLCAGFMIFKPNKKCIKCLEIAMKIMKDNWDTPGKLAIGGGADQRAINLAMKDINIKVGILDLKEYPNGARYFNNITSIYKSFKPKIVHNNYIVGTKNKIERFKKHNLWLLMKFDFKKSKDWDKLTFSDKLKIYGNNLTYNYAILADKYRVKKYIKNLNIKDLYISKVLKVININEDIPLDLKNHYIIKTNNGCGDIIIINNKKIKKMVSRGEILKPHINNYSQWKQKSLIPVDNTYEHHYKFIKPVIFAEEYLGDNLIDYKFFCIHGKVEFLILYKDRFTNTCVSYFDKNLRKLDINGASHWPVCDSYKFKTNEKNIIFKMIKISEQISHNLEFARIDLYFKNNKIYFGEITLTPIGCQINIKPESYNKYLGEKWY